ncbi:RNA polymerase-binding protein DksA [Massilia sp. CF038]|uniref:RNA polymerase-binding protein DksA n=1 Tax=Massilia sp. CF038 TaxID=1881045 RepID=UPI001E60C7B6|nr:RNA polymerase-binding protein DksA [Massilia sp. CF038]
MTKTVKKTGKAGVVKAVAGALAKKIAGALTPAVKAKPAAKPAAKAAARPAPKPAPKKAAAGSSAKSAAVKVKAAAKAPAKTASKSAPTSVPKKSATAATKAAKTVTAKAVTKVVAKAATKAPAKAAPTTQAKPAATTARPASKAAPKAAAAVPRTSTKQTVQQQAVKVSESGTRATTDKGGSAEIADKMKTSVVSKVSEVMTKTTKSTPAVATEGRLLSEEEIRAMNEKDYMNPAQLAFFKARLQQLEKDLLKNAGETTEHLRETVLVPDPADRATIEEEHALELRTRDRERKLLKKVQQSIAAIDAGDYGWCEETGEPIGIPRLIARPTATLSLEAQQRRELKQKLYGD